MKCVETKQKKIPDDEMFCRDSLIFAYSDMISDLTDQQIFATKKGLRVEKEIDKKKIKEKLLNLIEEYYDNLNSLGNKGS